MLDAYSRIIIRRADGTREVITRKGHVDPHEAVRSFQAHGTVLAVRHDQMPDGGTVAQTIAAHKMSD